MPRQWTEGSNAESLVDACLGFVFRLACVVLFDCMFLRDKACMIEVLCMLGIH